ncbi:DUF4838 domain-containing protein [Planctomycetota bacterium]
MIKRICFWLIVFVSVLVILDGCESVSNKVYPVKERSGQWYNSLEPEGQCGKGLTLAEKGKSRYSILISPKATTQDEKAAQELQQWLKEMTGAELPIVAEDERVKDKSRIISIGQTRALEAARLQAAKEDLEDEGYGIGVKGKRLYLWGGRTRGVINAVFALLEEDLGCRWYTDEHFRIPKTKKLSFKPVARTYKPALKLKDPFYQVSFDGVWSLRNRTNAPRAKVPEKWGGRIDYGGLFVHTFHTLLPPEKYFEEHPEYFMLDENGERKTHQLCTTNDDVVRIVTESVLKVLRDKPNTSIVSVSKTDGGGSCLCEKCKVLDDAEGTNMAALLYLVNKVAEAIEEDYPDVIVSTLAYLETVRVPKTIRPRKNVAIRLCNDEVGSWRRPFEPGEVCEFGYLVKEWSKVHDRINIWDYNVNFSHYMAPMPNMEVIAKNVRFLVANNAECIMTQGAYQSPGAERDWMRSWVIAKLMWDPSLDVFELMADFIYGHFGEAAPAIAEYNKLLRGQKEKYIVEMSETWLNEHYDGIRYGMDHPFLSKKFLEKATEIYDRAEKLAENEQVLHRVQRDRLAIMYVKLMRGPEFVGDEYGSVLERFEEIARRVGVTHLREGGRDLDEKLDNWKEQWRAKSR